MQAVTRITCAILCLICGHGAWAQNAVADSTRPVARNDAPPDDPSWVATRPPLRDMSQFRPLALALEAMRKGDWELARERAAGDGALAQDLVEWHRLRAGNGSAAEVMAFLARRPDWPGLPYLKEQSEAAFANAPTDLVLAFFDGHRPRTGTGALALARALRDAEQSEAANAVLIAAWKNVALEPTEQNLFEDGHTDLLAPHHLERLDLGLWRGWTTNPRRMEALVSADQWQLAQARLGLRASGAEAAVPDALKDDPGLAYERFRRLRGTAAQDAILAQSSSAETLGRPSFWAPHRRSMARQVMRNGDLDRAYAIASTHFLDSTGGRDFADLEWLSGYLALRLEKPDLALRHFDAFGAVAVTPISAARAGYWRGRAYAALGDTEASQAAYAAAAQFQTAFYGLLAAEQISAPFPAALAGEGPQTPWEEGSFTASTVHKAAVLLLAAGEDSLAERFWTHLAESQPPGEIALMGEMLRAFGEPHIEVMLGKRAAQAGLEIAAPYFAVPDWAQTRQAMPPELILAIARRESEFDPRVISPAGARGLMQLMPGTAREVAGDLGLGYAQSRLTSDPAYNAQLGTEYLRQMSRRYDGNPVLMSIAYNAGPGRADRWSTRFGDPRGRAVDIVDWIEEIPFRETRNYVMRVTESLPVYRARLGLDPLPETFSDLLKGSSLKPRAVQGE